MLKNSTPSLRNFASTLVAETPHLGIHVYAQTLDPPRRKIRLCREHPLDILGSGGYAVAPPSIVDEKAYRFIGSARQILWLEQNPLATILKRGRELGWKMRTPAASQSARNDLLAITPSRTLTGNQRQVIVQALIPYWQHGRRHELTIYLLGLLIKRGIMKDDAEAIVRAICQAADDEELTERLAQVSYHYSNRLQLGSKLKGMAGLRELLGVEEI